MKTKYNILSIVLLIGLQAQAGQVKLKDQIGMCLTYDFRQEIPLDKVAKSANSVESVNTEYVLGSLPYGDLKVSFYIQRSGRTVVFYPREFSPALIFYNGIKSPGFPSNNLYAVLKKLSDMVGIAVDGTLGYCYVPLEGCRIMFIDSSHIILRALGDINVQRVFVSCGFSSSISINNNNVKLIDFHGDYHQDITSYFVQAVKQKTDLEISAYHGFRIMIFYQEETKQD